MLQFLVIAGYLLLTLVLGVLSFRASKETPTDFFLADRKTGAFVLFFTLIATNFSAFFFLGFAGAGYRIGYSYYGIMAFGTAFVALSFYFLGDKIRILGEKKGYITPPELIGGQTASQILKFVYLAVMVVFTIPYLAIQPIGAGLLLQEMTGGWASYFQGAVALTAIIIIYVFIGGMRSVAWTDVFKGVLMFTLMLAAVWIIGEHHGGLAEANKKAFLAKPELFSRSGAGVFFTHKLWFSYMLLWLLCVPMFPQMFTRFFMAGSSRPLKISAAVYPIVTAVLFIGPIIIGVLGHLSFPDLAGKAADNILPMMLNKFVPDWLAAFLMVGALAAFMSTMDSQLLALSSMLTRDVYMKFFKQDAQLGRQVLVGRILVVVLAIAGLAIAYQPPATIFQIATQAFTGLAVLFPTTVAVLYWKNTSAVSCVVSIVVGEAMVVGFQTGFLSSDLSFGFLPVVPIVLTAALIICAGSAIPPILTKRKQT